jgi:hypothetical protein
MQYRLNKIFGIAIFFFAIIFCTISVAQSPDWKWGKSMSNNCDLYSVSIVVDRDGNTYSTGNFRSTLDFDPGPGIFNLTPLAGDNLTAFILKLDSSGNFVWVIAFTRYNGSCNATAIALDSDDNIYTIGTFSGFMDFNPGIDSFILNSTGPQSDVFISKLDKDGNFVWAKKIDDSDPLSTAIDASDNLYIAGGFRGTKDFDPGPGVYNLISTNSSYDDCYICKIDSAGNLVWAYSIVGTNSSDVNSIYVDGTASILLTGNFGGTMDFDPGPGIDTVTTSGTGVFAIKLDSTGNFMWGSGLTNGVGFGNDILSDDSGNVYVTGYFRQTMDFDPGQGVYNLSTSNSSDADIFITKLDNSGNFISAKRIGAHYTDFAYSMVRDNNNSIYLTGYFSGNVPFNTDSGNHVMSSTLFNSLFILKLNSQLNFEWVKVPEGIANSYAVAMVMDNASNIHLIGGSSVPSMMFFNQDTLINTLGNNNILIAKLDHILNYQVDTPEVPDFDPLYAGQDTGQDVYYFDFNPDTVLVWNDQFGILDLDLNHDGTVDFTLKGYHSYSPGFSDVRYYLKCLNGNEAISLTDTSGEIFIEPIKYGHQIDTTAAWISGDSLVMSRSETDIIYHFTIYQGPWNMVVEGYIGVRLFVGMDTIYGYIHINRRGGPFVSDFGILDIQTGVNEVSQAITCVFYPNPFNASATLFTGSNFASATLKIYNAFGEVVREEVITSAFTSIARNNLSKGVYFIRVYDDEKEWHRKIIVD